MLNTTVGDENVIETVLHCMRSLEAQSV